MQLPAKWKEQPLDRKVGWGITWVTGPLVVVGALVSIYFIFKALLGLIALGVGIVAAIALANFLPAINLRLANFALKVMKIEARKNPIETLERARMVAADRMVAAENRYSILSAAASDYHRDLTATRKEFPEEDLSEEEKTAGRLDQMVADLEGQIREGQRALALYERKLAATKRKYTLKLKVLEAEEKIGNMDGQAVLDDILQEEALDSVATGLNQTLTTLETRLKLSDQNFLGIGRKAGRIPLTIPDEVKQVTMVRK